MDPQDEVPYSLLSTAGAALVVKSLAGLIGTDRSTAVPRNEKVLRENMDEAAAKAGDPALVDLGTLVLGPTSGDVERALVGEAAADQQDKLSEFFKKFADALGTRNPRARLRHRMSSKLWVRRKSKLSQIPRNNW